MPALPELEVLKRDLEREVLGRRIKSAEVRAGTNSMKLIPRHGRRKEFQDLLQGAKILAVGRIGVHLLLELDNGRALVIRLGRAGLLRKTSSSEEHQPHTHIVVDFTIGGQLRIIDPLRAAEVFVADAEAARDDTTLRAFAIDPYQNHFTWQRFSSMLEQRSGSMKDLMMADDFICGLGDIYSDEVLFAAGLRHDHSAGRLSSQDVRRFYRGLTETLQDALKARGTSWPGEGFVDLHGSPGSYGTELKVWQREGEPCRRCRHGIRREKINGWDAFFCPQCQS